MAGNRSSSDRPRRAGRVRSYSQANLPLIDAVETSRGLAHLSAVWTQAAAHVFFDTVGVANQLAADVADSLIDGLLPVQVTGGARGPTTTGARSDRVPMLTQVSDSVTWALQDAAEVIAQNAEQFNRASRTGETVPPTDTLSAARSGTASSVPPGV